MNSKNSRFQSFDLIIILIFIGSASSLYFYGRIPFIISLGLIIIAIWNLLVLGGRLAAPLYLEGSMIRNLIANNGKLPIGIFKKHFKKYSSYDEHLKRLLDRDNIEIVDETVILKDENYTKGLQNRIMMWGTRKIKY